MVHYSNMQMYSHPLNCFSICCIATTNFNVFLLGIYSNFLFERKEKRQFCETKLKRGKLIDTYLTALFSGDEQKIHLVLFHRKTLDFSHKNDSGILSQCECRVSLFTHLQEIGSSSNSTFVGAFWSVSEEPYWWSGFLLLPLALLYI